MPISLSVRIKSLSKQNRYIQINRQRFNFRWLRNSKPCFSQQHKKFKEFKDTKVSWKWKWNAWGSNAQQTK